MTDFATDAAKGMIKREAAQAALTASGFIGDPWDQKNPCATSFSVVINLEAVKVSGGNEDYTFTVVGYNAANRSDSTVLGTGRAVAATTGNETVTAKAGDQLVIKARTHKNGIDYRYVDLHLAAAGTSPSVTCNARITKETL